MFKKAPLCATALLLQLMAPAYSTPVPVKTNVLFILDNSGSMWQRVDGEPKVESAKKILSDVLNELPPDSKLGLMTYGHRRKSDCKDIELVSPIGSETGPAIAKRVNAFKPKGRTPIAASLTLAAEAFKGVDGAKMIVLITDGGEECNGDPCAAAKQLAASGLVVKINVVGYSLNLDKTKRDEVECIAKEGKGRFFEVHDKKSLFAAMMEVKKEIVSPEVQTATVAKVETVTTTAPVVSVPLPSSAVKPNEVNLLLSSEGGRVALSSTAGWENVINGKDRSFMWTWTGQEVVFSFKDDKPAKFSRFALGIPGTQPQNVKEFEVLASDVSPEGPYRMLGHFRTRNALQFSLYQEFTFNETTAKYMKFRLISNYGYEIQGWGNTQIYQLRLMGTRM